MINAYSLVKSLRQGWRYHIGYSDKTWPSGHFSNLVFYESLMDFLGYNDVMHPGKDNRVQNIDAHWNLVIFPYLPGSKFPQNMIKNDGKKTSEGPILSISKIHLIQMEGIIITHNLYVTLFLKIHFSGLRVFFSTILFCGFNPQNLYGRIFLPQNNVG